MDMKNETRIPKVIHYCWLSGSEYPEDVRHCIETWKRVLPDYELVLWDSQRFDLAGSRFVREACEQRKWAFAADYIRLHALYHCGGIYLDSDVEVLKSFDRFLHHSAFSSVEYWKEINAIGIEGAVLGAEKGNPWIGRCLEYYQQRSFLNERGERDETIISGIISSIASEHFGFKYRPELQHLSEGICIYPPVVFTHLFGEYSPEETHAVHRCAGSWRDKPKRTLGRRLWSRMASGFKKVTGLG